MKTVSKCINSIAAAAGGVSFLGIVVMMLLITVDVLLRKFFSSPINGSYEIVECLLMVVVFSSFSFSQMRKGHVKVTVLIDMMPWRVRRLLDGLFELMCSAMAGILGYSAIVQALYLHKGGWVSGILSFPLYPFHWVEAIMSFVFALVIFCHALTHFIGMGNKENMEKPT